ncbi:MAG: pantoate--beta-alanine ligase [Chloroflexi bacterium]|nr:pantoate--beta-alanine ligase [Chloroflexota bacterium]
MKVVRTVAQLRAWRKGLSGTLGFVPTMGCLHQGHLALVSCSKSENDTTAVSIFVNPTQFGPREDLARYPRDLPRDLALLEKEGSDLVFAPETEEIYPPGFSTWVEVEGVTERLEGASRPGHFRGVATVVAKLLNLLEPHRAYFGQKDAQQLAVIKKMVRDLNMDLEIVSFPTVREPDGLAMSSRNIFLNPRERQAATALYRSLCLAQEMYKSGERNAGKIREAMIKLIQEEPLAQIDYVSIAHPETLEEVEKLAGPVLVSLAVRIGPTRLVDNITFAEGG